MHGVRSLGRDVLIGTGYINVTSTYFIVHKPTYTDAEWNTNAYVAKICVQLRSYITPDMAVTAVLY